MNPVLRNYTKAAIPTPFYTKPKVLGHINDVKLYTKTCIYKSPAIKASFIRLNENERYKDTSNYHSSIFYIVSGDGTLNQKKFETGDVLCTNKFADIHANKSTVIYNVDDSPLMDYFSVSPTPEDECILYYSNKSIMDEIEKIENEGENEPNRLGVIFGTSENNTISNTLWCLMTKTLPKAIQPAHRHNSIALDYCVKGDGYTLLSKTRDNEGNLVNPIRIDWKDGMVFLTPPGWWHSHHSTSDEPGYVFPVQDAGLHMFMDTLDITFS